jgi:hypothetical protein
MVKKWRCQELRRSRQIRRKIGYRPLPHRIVDFRKEEINPRGQRVSNYGSRVRPLRT